MCVCVCAYNVRLDPIISIRTPPVIKRSKEEKKNSPFIDEFPIKTSI